MSSEHEKWISEKVWCRRVFVSSCMNPFRERDTGTGTDRWADRRETCWCASLLCVWISSSFFFPSRAVCVCACLPMSRGEDVWVCEPPSRRRSLYLISAGSDWRADSLPYFFLTPLCSPTPDGHSSVPYRSDYLRKHRCEVEAVWSQAGVTGPVETDSGNVFIYFYWTETHRK